MEPSAGVLVGLVRRLSNTQSLWTRWFGWERLAVYESEDEPLVCTLRRGWGWSSVWEVQDADGHMVGKISKSNLRGPLVRHLVRVQRLNEPTTDFHDRQGRTLATLTQDGHERLLSFASECKGDPFARMLILAAALIAFV